LFTSSRRIHFKARAQDWKFDQMQYCWWPGSWPGGEQLPHDRKKAAPRRKPATVANLVKAPPTNGLARMRWFNGLAARLIGFQ
jgi:hypothetical protein